MSKWKKERDNIIVQVKKLGIFFGVVLWPNFTYFYVIFENYTLGIEWKISSYNAVVEVVS